ncbi:protein-tyrosine phosphatase-like protein [Cokeromyces recurvatus]|uniref:protein-tyrosine phosphatase-like protein n=1 Tax=Cokeromyces recurvatus TaxID=90255 RepID=UPI002220DDE0|nr:protein-tyrosine phosphatase-like protein [Cokeromyces recurvatus]KAI7906988.1 protein-tyrosine phosphatase-like protein [Cokeromyces recurvatus]
MTSNKPISFTTTNEGIQTNRQQPSIPTTSTSTLPVFSTACNTTVKIIPPRTAKEPKTSTSHPINISWVIPIDILNYLSTTKGFPNNLDLYDFLDPNVKEKWLKHDEQQKQLHSESTNRHGRGNLCLSSCPGKKVRLTGPVGGRAAINRDLDMDFERMRTVGITMIICCLGDDELAFLGAPWPKYIKSAKEHGMEVIRLPMLEGRCPNTLFEVKEIVKRVNIEIYKGNNVLAHCRGGVGRAGLFAGCWLLENLLCKDAERTVAVLRQRRSSKAIETYIQAEYLIRYSITVRHPLGISSMVTEGAIVPFEFEVGPPSLSLIAELEKFILTHDSSQQQNDEIITATTEISPPTVIIPNTISSDSSSSSPTQIRNTAKLLYSPRY